MGWVGWWVGEVHGWGGGGVPGAQKLLSADRVTIADEVAPAVNDEEHLLLYLWLL